MFFLMFRLLGDIYKVKKNIGFEVLMTPTSYDYGLLACSTLLIGESLMFQKNISPTSSGLKSKPSKKPAEALMLSQADDHLGVLALKLRELKRSA
jgi:pyruvate/oxaloacetate carboxyltransferase